MDQVYHECTILATQTIISETVSPASGLDLNTGFDGGFYGGRDLFDCFGANYGSGIDGVV
jgi:hypothetical protein